MLGLPDGITACLFDLDGVLTRTAEVHAKAWKQTFDPFLQERGQEPFDIVKDYDEYVDGKPRLDGVRDFLASRGIDPADDEVARLADAKNDLVLKLIREDGVEAYEGSVRYLHAARDAGLRRAVVS
jgi:beta-phosphoglucomutase-like phosphatase (HAD superfamily)